LGDNNKTVLTRGNNKMAFKKGKSGNPNGRPKDSGAAAQVRRAINDKSLDLLDALMTQALEDKDAATAMALLNN